MDTYKSLVNWLRGCGVLPSSKYSCTCTVIKWLTSADTSDFLVVRPSSRDPPICPLGRDGRGWPENFPHDMFIQICGWLSREDVLNLRPVCRYFSETLAPVVFRSVVPNFDKSMFDINVTEWEVDERRSEISAGKYYLIAPKAKSMFDKYGSLMSKFGIAFEVDLQGLYSAPSKVIQTEHTDWFGTYKWPVKDYPHYPSLQLLENLGENLHLLKGVMGKLTKVSELGLSVDSGHGWLEGPDMSDLAIWNLRSSKGSKLFGKVFPVEKKDYQWALRALLKWGQVNTLTESLEALHMGHQDEDAEYPELEFLQNIDLRDYESYELQADQPDFDPEAHTGGTVPQTIFGAGNPPQGQNPLHAANWVLPGQPAMINPVQNQPHGNFNARIIRQSLLGRLARPCQRRAKKGEIVQPQWPLIFNGYNLAAEAGGHCHFIQDKVADPKLFPLQPGHLREAQAQWLMETVWAQKAFLSAYTTALLENKCIFSQVHSLHIGKISSGLLGPLEEREFWQAMPSLKRLKILVSPDWRAEYGRGDQSFQTNMLISPVEASIKFAHFLQSQIARIEHLCTLTIGFIGGGEHAPGLFARNQHVLPAPITSNPRAWLTDHVHTPDPNTMMTFNHIKELTIENAWLSPCMLEGFMVKSKDSSLRELTLDSVSLTGVNSTRPNAPLTTIEDGLKPEYAPAAWLQERLPSDHCWPAIIDRLSPGKTFSELKYAAGLIDPVQVPPPTRVFRGYVKKLTFKSCGYIRISGVSQLEFNQNGLVMPNASPRDHGLHVREIAFHRVRAVGESAEGSANGGATGGSGAPVQGLIMLKEKDQRGRDYFGLGRLTQCIHPVEKRVLEQAWGMRFGWGDDMERWRAVEDGCFEGGTGRFSGVVEVEKGQEKEEVKTD